MAVFYPCDSRGNQHQVIFRSDVMMARFNTQVVSDFRDWGVRTILPFSSPNVLKFFSLWRLRGFLMFFRTAACFLQATPHRAIPAPGQLLFSVVARSI